MKWRILKIQQGDSIMFYPQKKGWFFWSYYYYTAELFDNTVRFDTIEYAENFIKYKKIAAEPKIKSTVKYL